MLQKKGLIKNGKETKVITIFVSITLPMRYLVDVLKANMQFQLEKELGEWPEMERW